LKSPSHTGNRKTESGDVLLLVEERLKNLCHGSEDLDRLLTAYLQDDSNDYERHTAEYFQLIRQRDPRYWNHGPVLALSFGGSNTKLMIASTEDGFLKVHHMRALKSPAKKIHLYDLLDQLFWQDDKVSVYLESENPVLSVVIPVMIGEDGIPQHPAKMPNIEGLLARRPQDFIPQMNFYNNMRQYFASRGKKMPWLYYQSDPIAAHIGGVSRIERLSPKEATFLLVCGTGMATADDHVNRVISRTPIMTMDEELFPKDETEGYIYETGCSGLLFYGLMRRAINLRKQEPGSTLKNFSSESFFESSNDSALVCRLWESTLDKDAFQYEKLSLLQKSVSKEAFWELQELASLLMKRLHITLSNAIVATAVKLNRDRGFKPYHVIFEGSVALNPHSFPEIVRETTERLQDKALFDSFGVQVPQLDLKPRQMRQVWYDASIDEKTRGKMEISLAGTAVLGMTDEILHRKGL
jgi:hypothetical protein